MFLSREGRDLGAAFQNPLGSQASSPGEGKDSAPLPSRDADLLEPPEWLQGSQASSSVWREDSGLLSRPCRKRRLSSRDEGGISRVSSSCGARGGFLARHDEDLREPLMRRQGSQVSMCKARGSASLLSIHGRGLGPQDALKKDSRSFSGCGGKPSFPSTSAGVLRELPRVPLRGEGSCGVGGASRDSAGFGALEEGLISRGGILWSWRGRSGLRWVWRNGRGPHLDLTPTAGSLQSCDRRVRPRLV